MEIKEGLYYTEENEWIRVEGNKAYIGITDYAQDAWARLCISNCRM